MNKTLKLASQLYVWPTMTNDIRNKISSCEECVRFLPSQESEPVIPETASRPMEKVSVDLYDLKGRTFVAMVDRYSGLPFTKQLSTEALWRVLMSWFNQFGYPLEMKTNNGPQFRGPFEAACSSVGIVHHTSSPYHLASNGLAESAVKSVKRLLLKTGGADGPLFRSVLLEWSCTPPFEFLKCFSSVGVRGQGKR